MPDMNQVANYESRITESGEGKYNFINENGELLYKEEDIEKWFDKVEVFNNGYAKAMRKTESGENKWNWIDDNGELVYNG